MADCEECPAGLDTRPIREASDAMQKVDRLAVAGLYVLLLTGMWLNNWMSENRQHAVIAEIEQVEEKLERHVLINAHPVMRAHVSQIENRLNDLDGKGFLVWPNQGEPKWQHLHLSDQHGDQQ